MADQLKTGFKTRKELALEFNLDPSTFDRNIYPIRDRLDFKKTPKRLYSPWEIEMIRNYFNRTELFSNDYNLVQV